MLSHTRFAVLLIGLCGLSSGAEPNADEWTRLTQQARGQTVYFQAWGGDVALNAHLQWVAQQVKTRFAIDLNHIKLADTSTAVSRLIAEVDAGNREAGSADLLWINGENFALLKQRQLLFGPWAEQQPNFALVEADRFPEMRRDFGVPTNGLESPWTRSQLIFYYDSERIASPPRSMPALLNWAREHPAEFTYPRPPAFLGTTFLKQAFIELAILEFGPETLTAFAAPVDEKFAVLTEPLWAFLDALHPHLLRGGRHFPQTGAQLNAALYDRETSLAFAFNPNEVVSAIARGDLAPATTSYVMTAGTLSNVSFVAIPVNAPNKAGAMIVANYLLSPEAQFRAAVNPRLASQPVLPFERFDAEQRAALDAAARAPGSLPAAELARTLAEPHPSWTTALEREWVRRYGGGGR